METAKPTQAENVPVSSTVERTQDGYVLTGPISAGRGAIGSNNVIWYPRGERLVVNAAQYAVPDPRDDRIATLEAALRHIRMLAGEALAYVFLPPDELVETIHQLAANALAGEAQPTSTVDEELAI